eukprot:31502-Pelagococcus_subviridis.AAC.14
MGTGVKENAPEALRRGVREFALQAFHPPPQRRARFPRLLELPRARLRRLRRLRGGFSRVRVLRERLLEPLAERDVFSARRLYRVERRQKRRSAFTTRTRSYGDQCTGRALRSRSDFSNAAERRFASRAATRPASPARLSFASAASARVVSASARVRRRSSSRLVARCSSRSERSLARLALSKPTRSGDAVAIETSASEVAGGASRDAFSFSAESGPRAAFSAARASRASASSSSGILNPLESKRRDRGSVVAVAGVDVAGVDAALPNPPPPPPPRDVVVAASAAAAAARRPSSSPRITAAAASTSPPASGHGLPSISARTSSSISSRALHAACDGSSAGDDASAWYIGSVATAALRSLCTRSANAAARSRYAVEGVVVEGENVVES